MRVPKLPNTPSNYRSRPGFTVSVLDLSNPSRTYRVRPRFTDFAPVLPIRPPIYRTRPRVTAHVPNFPHAPRKQVKASIFDDSLVLASSFAPCTRLIHERIVTPSFHAAPRRDGQDYFTSRCATCLTVLPLAGHRNRRGHSLHHRVHGLGRVVRAEPVGASVLSEGSARRAPGLGANIRRSRK